MFRTQVASFCVLPQIAQSKINKFWIAESATIFAADLGELAATRLQLRLSGDSPIQQIVLLRKISDLEGLAVEGN